MRRDARILDARTRRDCLHHRQFNGRERIDATHLIQHPVRSAPKVRLEETGILGGDRAHFRRGRTNKARRDGATFAGRDGASWRVTTFDYTDTATTSCKGGLD